MAGHTFFGKQRLCYTEVSDFTDYQGVGHDPLYRRYDSVSSIVRRVVPERYQGFLAVPQYLEDTDRICWHIDNWDESPVRLTGLEGGERARYQRIKEATVAAYKSALMSLDGEDLQILGGAVKYLDDDRIYCADDKVFAVAWGMTPDAGKHKVTGSVIHDFSFVRKYKLSFDAGAHGTFPSKLDSTILRAENAVLTDRDVPLLNVDEGWDFTGWSPDPVGYAVKGPKTFVATYGKAAAITPSPIPVPPPPPASEPDRIYTCRFDAGENGTVNGSPVVRKAGGTRLRNDEIPSVTPKSGYRFAGWDVPPADSMIDGDKTFVARYKRRSWYKRWWLWLLWLLLFLLGLWLLSWLLDDCHGCSGRHAENGVIPADTVARADGTVVDDNGRSRPVTGSDGVLPEESVIVAPAMGEDGADIPVVEQPGAPDIIANRLFLFMEDENDNVEALARDFKAAYPGGQYAIIGYDKEVKLLVVQVPADEREQMRKTLNARIPNHKFIVFDEEIYEINGGRSPQTVDVGWHLDAIHLKQGWAITRGTKDVRIAIVDDGIEATHPMFKGRIVDAYNVFTQDNRLSLGEGHGTHTAGLAAGSAEFYSKGASGVAPSCLIMPVQVFDNKQCPLSALVAGIMYAVHHDADVVNVSVGPSFKGLNALPVEQQDQIARQQFKNVEKLWARVCGLAARKNAILVFAAGNDDILSSVPPENRNRSAIVVAAVDRNLCPTDFTNYGPCSDISAPGKNIYSAYPRGAFQSCDGTSMAAPIVSGTIALMKSLKKDLTTVQARNCLYNTGGDVFGWMPPMVLVDKALQGVKAGRFGQPRERVMKPVPDGSGDDSSARQTTPVAETPAPAPSGETGYEAIRRKIAEYKKKISELEKLLPNK